MKQRIFVIVVVGKNYVVADANGEEKGFQVEGEEVVGRTTTFLSSTVAGVAAAAVAKKSVVAHVVDDDVARIAAVAKTF